MQADLLREERSAPVRPFLDLPTIVWLAGAFAGGIALAERLQPSMRSAVWVAGGTGAVWAICWLTRRPGLRLLGVVLFFVALGCAHATTHAAREPFWPQTADGRVVVAQGILHSPPEAASGGWRAVVRLYAFSLGPSQRSSGRPSSGRIARARQPPGDIHLSIDSVGSMQPVDGLVRMVGRGDAPVAGVGAVVRVRGRFRAGRPAGNPGERSERDALRRRGLVGILRVDAEHGITVVRPAGWSVRGAIASLRLRVVESALRALPRPQGGLFLSLLLGIDTHLPAEVYRQFSLAGLVHLMVVSGAQVAIVAGACAWAARLARLSLMASAAVTGLGVVMFAAMVGWAPSISRAVVMAVIGLGAIALGRQRDRSATLATAGLALLVAHPSVLFDIGFQLSFAATWGLLFVSPVLQRQFAVMGSRASAAFAVTLGAQVAVAPLIASHFQTIAVAGLVANVLVLPLIAALVPAGFALVPIVVLAPALGEPLLGLLQPGLAAVLWLGGRFGDLSWSTVPTPPVTALFTAALYGILAAWIGLASGRWVFSRVQRIVATAVTVAVFAIWIVTAMRPPTLLTVTALDVGQGDAILIQSPSGRTVLIDGGGEIGGARTAWDVGRMRVVPALRRAGVRRLDVVLLSHPHEDHVGGLPAVLENFQVGLVLDPGVPHPSPSYARLLRLVEAGKIPYQTARQGMTIDLGAGVLLTVLYPPEPIPQLDGDPVHWGSVVARLTYGETAALFTGDAEASVERYLLDQGVLLSSQVLKVAHHGSRTSTTPEFLSRVNPRIAVMSLSADNTFGHPHPTTLDTLAGANVAIYRTDLDGAVALMSDG
ncbi:MAG: DNA internalization-related competence protein ComEC/Rec2, partial [Armatimonadota bacterium]